MKLVIYGINEDTIAIINSIISSHDIVAISDSYTDKKTLYGYTFVKPDELYRLGFDYIIVCVKTRNTFESIKEKLICYGIAEETILSFRNLYYESRVDQVMLEAQIHNRVFDGLIIGISHAAYAINPKYLDGSWANIAVPSEDIMNHNYVIDKLICDYFEQIRSIKRIIIDLYDYSVLNFITNYSKYSVDFYDLYCGDGIERHDSFMELEKSILNRNNYSSNYARRYRTIRREIFDDDLVFRNYRNQCFKSSTPIDFFYKDCVYCEDELDPLDNGTSFIPKLQHDNNIAINIEQLSFLIEKIYKMNPDMKVYFVLIPRVAEIEKKLLPELINYKNVLLEEIKRLIEKYPKISLFDYKGINEISLYREGYCSVAHMNIKGQKRFTEILNKDILQGD